jgi:hypothetical protein
LNEDADPSQGTEQAIERASVGMRPAGQFFGRAGSIGKQVRYPEFGSYRNALGDPGPAEHLPEELRMRMSISHVYILSLKKHGGKV